MKRLARMVAAVLLTFSGPAVAAAVAYDRLNHEWWTSTTTRAATPAPARPETEAVPAPSPQGAPEPPDARHPWDLGSCVTPTATRSTPCASGALRVVGSIGTHTGKPCHDVPETTHVRRAGAYTLCLASL